MSIEWQILQNVKQYFSDTKATDTHAPDDAQSKIISLVLTVPIGGGAYRLGGKRNCTYKQLVKYWVWEFLQYTNIGRLALCSLKLQSEKKEVMH